MLVRLLTLALTALAYLGLARAWRAPWTCCREGRCEPGGLDRLALTSMVLALALLPILVVLKDGRLVYQTHKLLLTVAPLLVAGLALLGRGAVPLLLVLGLGTYATAEMAVRSGRAAPEPRSLAHRL